MNLPNKLTVFRVVLVIPFVIVLLGGYNDYVALLLFVVACLTDFFDGMIARKYNLITNFGKFMDPLADKLLVAAAMICLIELDRIPSYIVVIIISREFIISGFRLVASDNGVVIAASKWGKYKTTFQMIMVILMIMNISVIATLTTAIMWIATVLTIISLVDYVVKNKSVLSDFK
ncbi:MAG: CDP-diacylglycerol--glycerol-3-phosphate 3-phosphatidyltransferase [Lachnospiraceae bacterium]